MPGVAFVGEAQAHSSHLVRLQQDFDLPEQQECLSTLGRGAAYDAQNATKSSHAK
jgi:hypothetical protein